jgi:hypothetical protein
MFGCWFVLLNMIMVLLCGLLFNTPVNGNLTVRTEFKVFRNETNPVGFVVDPRLDFRSALSLRQARKLTLFQDPFEISKEPFAYKRLAARNYETDIGSPSMQIIHDRALPGTMGDMISQSLPNLLLAKKPSGRREVKAGKIVPSSAPRSSKVAGLGAQDVSSKVESSEAGVDRKRFDYIEIEVSHSEHVFTLLGKSLEGKKEVLYQCKVGLGGPAFPTPVGTYFVTHIYDDNPWWIPPKDRAWAAGDSPSQRVYGGIMAPLLKKRDVRSKKEPADTEDKIAGQVKLEDYGYRFHGTNAPRSIGRNQSHGCVRMLPKDVKEVAGLIKTEVGTSDRKESENGTYAVLKSPVRLNLIK